jgi:hypothetical protein
MSLVVSRWSFAGNVCRRRLLTTNDRRPATEKVYNNAVNPAALPKPVSDNQHQHRHSMYAAEASGLLIMAVLLLVLIIVRYWRYIPWNAR